MGTITNMLLFVVDTSIEVGGTTSLKVNRVRIIVPSVIIPIIVAAVITVIILVSIVLYRKRR